MQPTAISLDILTTDRPSSFIFSLQIGLDFQLSQKYGSNHLLTVLSTLGLRSSYAEAAPFQVLALQHPARKPQTESFTQFVFDSTYVNICTIDGFKFFHSMGWIQFVTPPNDPTLDQPLRRLEKIPCTSSVGQFGRVPMKVFENNTSGGLQDIEVRKLANMNLVSTTVLHTWHMMCPRSYTFPLQILHLPINYHTIYTVLLILLVSFIYILGTYLL